MYQRPGGDQEPRQQQDATGVTTPGETTPVTRRRALSDGTAALLAGGAIAATATLGTATDAFAAAAKKDKPKSRGSAKATAISVNARRSRSIRRPARCCSTCCATNCTCVAPSSAAASRSQQLGVPVRVQWMRADEHGWDPKGPATIHQMQGGIDETGLVVGYQHEGWLGGGEYDTSIIGAALAGKTAYSLGAFTGWSGDVSYTFPNAEVICNQQDDLGPRRTMAWP